MVAAWEVTLEAAHASMRSGCLRTKAGTTTAFIKLFVPTSRRARWCRPGAYCVGTDRQRSGGHTPWRWRDCLHGACVQRCAAGWRPVHCEHACDERSGMCGAGDDEAGPSLAPELLTDPLIGRPCSSTRSGDVE